MVVKGEYNKISKYKKIVISQLIHQQNLKILVPNPDNY